MEKIPCLFRRNFTDGESGEGVATRKFDGTCCLVRGGVLHRRYQLRAGKRPPAEWEASTPVDSKTGKQQGWVPVDYFDPNDKWHMKAWLKLNKYCVPDGTYELIGPKIQNNAELQEEHILVRHGDVAFLNAPWQPPEENITRTFEGLKTWLSNHAVEGIVFWHSDGRKAKIRRHDFGLEWPIKNLVMKSLFNMLY